MIAVVIVATAVPSPAADNRAGAPAGPPPRERRQLLLMGVHMIGSCPTLSVEILEVMKGILESKLQIEKTQADTGRRSSDAITRDDAHSKILKGKAPPRHA